MKLGAYTLGEELKSLGFNFYSGVPCSFLSDLINYAINESNFVMSANEGDAVATCAGAYLTGKKSVVLMQNSGLTNAISPLTSLNYTFKLPVLGFVSLRGEKGLCDEPQHELMGTITEKLLELMEIRWEYLSSDVSEMKEQLSRANDSINDKKNFFFIVKKATFNRVELIKRNKKENKNLLTIVKTKNDELPMRLDVLHTLNTLKDNNTILLATTGKSGRELFEIGDSKNNFYMVGSMGCISSIGLGLSLNTSKKVIAIDGDGALLMRMGSLAINGFYAPQNLLHILIDNNMHDSTGGQFTVSNNVDFVSIAKSCGYTNSIYVHDLKELEEQLKSWKKNSVLTFIYIKVKKGTKENLGRPNIKPFKIKDRLMEFIVED
ncbi:phosphonopyruvate decarboxylase [Arcobacter nitrofigilis DSM 7299]|uniref:Phosphonopyruvate decarboxylase n=1 Tax=Arcobacter nitrofigilis (strain ATCC 33309 / DSM 7299 / CCUG 15893 / LMG 7604 / NCTC 12251 / CI) TaxID=572480 RepID=D5V7H0_ARCNC|nr:phosphonopyruvate decarboxylase [Arcobacter nitrofigilis]ADG94590.1 phosphonopyruvate decarboxylase [Arcobacter nitrofigilis DSM 7299]